VVRQFNIPMRQIVRLLWVTLVAFGASGRPTERQTDMVEGSVDLRTPASPPETASGEKGLDLKPFGHLAIGVGVAGAAALGTILAGEAGLRLYEYHLKAKQKERDEAARRAKDIKYIGEQGEREQQAKGLLLDLAQRYADKMKGQKFEKFERFKVPKELSKSLAHVFFEDVDGSTNLEDFKNLQKTLAPLLDFE